MRFIRIETTSGTLLKQTRLLELRTLCRLVKTAAHSGHNSDIARETRRGETPLIQSSETQSGRGGGLEQLYCQYSLWLFWLQRD